MTLRNKVVVVTGGARGVGRYVATSFAREGCRLAISEIGAERMAQTAGELRELGAEVLTATVDVSNEAAVGAFMVQVFDQYGRLDVLVNNAGVVSHRHWGVHWPPVREMEWSFWRRIPVHEACAPVHAAVAAYSVSKSPYANSRIFLPRRSGRQVWN
jgi:NAD(P)-dependent dehydrogenase (short-subunit alcohol dehydrogenase family)